MHCKLSGIEKAMHVSMVSTIELPVRRRRFGVVYNSANEWLQKERGVSLTTRSVEEWIRAKYAKGNVPR